MGLTLHVPPDTLSIGEVAQRAGVAASALRFYERERLISPARTLGNQRQYPREVLRRVAFIRAAQSVGLSLIQIRAALATLPSHKAPTKAEWAQLSRTWQPALDARINALVALRDNLTQCIGCGCLSLKSCALFNAQDALSSRGAGAHLLLRQKKA